MTTIGSIFASLGVSYLLIWVFGLMAAVLVACIIGHFILKLIDHWRFMNWLNQLHR